MSIFNRLFTRSPDPRQAMRPLYLAIVARGRAPCWYQAGIPDTMDGRFEIVAAILAHVLLRLEGDASARLSSTHLTELFVDDMDGQLRQIGVGDLMVGKHIGKMMAALGGRLGAYRVAQDADQRAQVIMRNIWGEAGADDAHKAAASDAGGRLNQFADALVAMSVAKITAGALPELQPDPLPYPPKSDGR